jgi:hypothetical protein
MAIQFESIQDPFGIATGGTILGKMLQEQNQQARSIAAQKEIKLADIMGQKEIQALGQQGDIKLQNLKNQGDIEQERIRQSNRVIPQTELQKKISGTVADSIIAVPSLETARQGLDRMEELSKSFTGLVGMGKAYVGNEATAEFNALGAAAIDPLVKIFNPSGPIAQQKLKWLADKASPKATDRQATIMGKINALRQLNESAQQWGSYLNNLYEKYGDNIPPQELLKYGKGVEGSLDLIIKNNKDTIGDKKEAPEVGGKYEKLPTGEEWNGQYMKGDDGKTYLNTNGKWSIVG